jgi:hypothetical protein
MGRGLPGSRGEGGGRGGGKGRQVRGTHLCPYDGACPCHTPRHLQPSSRPRPRAAAAAAAAAASATGGAGRGGAWQGQGKVIGTLLLRRGGGAGGGVALPCCQLLAEQLPHQALQGGNVLPGGSKGRRGREQATAHMGSGQKGDLCCPS